MESLGKLAIGIGLIAVAREFGAGKYVTPIVNYSRELNYFILVPSLLMIYLIYRACFRVWRIDKYDSQKTFDEVLTNKLVNKIRRKFGSSTQISQNLYSPPSSSLLCYGLVQTLQF
jgi:hypothetical protein